MQLVCYSGCNLYNGSNIRIGVQHQKPTLAQKNAEPPRKKKTLYAVCSAPGFFPRGFHQHRYKEATVVNLVLLATSHGSAIPPPPSNKNTHTKKHGSLMGPRPFHNRNPAEFYANNYQLSDPNRGQRVPNERTAQSQICGMVKYI